jgi:hypothetical protein
VVSMGEEGFKWKGGSLRKGYSIDITEKGGIV